MGKYAFLLAVMVAGLFGMATMVKAAETMTPSTKGEMKSMTGYIIDTKCTSEKAVPKGKAPDELTALSKTCTLSCRVGGCSLYSDGKVWKLDKESNIKVKDFLKKPDSSLYVKADVSPAKGDKITLMNIENAK